MNRKAALVMVTALLLLSPLTALAGAVAALEAKPPAPAATPAGKGAAPAAPRRGDRLAEALNLSEAQRQQIDALRDAEQKQLGPLFKDTQQTRAALQALTKAETFDEAAVRKLAEKLAAASTEQIVAQVRTSNRIYALLTPEQRKLADNLGQGRPEPRPPANGR